MAKLKKQSNEDVLTFVLTRLAIVLGSATVIAQVGKARGWWA